MQRTHTTLFAADFSEDSLEAFRVACSLAVGHTTRVVVLHVIEPDRDEAGTTSGAEELRAALIRRLRGVYIPDHALEVEYRLCVGSPPAGILLRRRGRRGRPDRDGDARSYGPAAADRRQRGHGRLARGALLRARPPWPPPRADGSRDPLRPSSHRLLACVQCRDGRSTLAGAKRRGSTHRHARHPAGTPPRRQHGGRDRSREVSTVPRSDPRATRSTRPRVSRGDAARAGPRGRGDPPNSRRRRVRLDRDGDAWADGTGSPPPR